MQRAKHHLPGEDRLNDSLLKFSLPCSGRPLDHRRSGLKEVTRFELSPNCQRKPKG